MKSDVAIHRLLNAASAVTLLGLALSAVALYVVYRGKPELGLVLLFFSLICDRMDGAIARSTNTASAFGAELDNLSDAIAFGLVPAAFVVLVGGQALMLMPALVLLLGGVLRLARYSYVGLIEREGRPYFVGMPIPYTVATLFILWPLIREFEGTIRMVLLSVTAVVLGWLMSSTILVPKGGRVEWFLLYTLMPLILVYHLWCFLTEAS